MPGKELFDWMKLVVTGRKIRRSVWEDPETHIALIGERLCIKLKKDGEQVAVYRPWIISLEDLIGDDWGLYTAPLFPEGELKQVDQTPKSSA